MQFLKTAFWVVLAVAIALFTKANYVPVTVKLWGDLVMETKLPVLVVGAFLAGAVPFWIMARATRWRMRKRLESTERALASAIASSPPPAPYTAEISEPAAPPSTPSPAGQI